jgi:hypothetical protein
VVQLWALDDDPEHAATAQCDTDLVYSVQFTAAILCGVARVVLGQAVRLPATPAPAGNLFCTWGRMSVGNFVWVIDREHKLAAPVDDLVWERESCIARRLPGGGLQSRTPFVQQLPREYQGPDAVTAYRGFYRAQRAQGAAWTRRTPPAWL